MAWCADYEDLLVANGIPLSQHGVLAVALNRDDALSAVSMLRLARVPILGGDVWTQRGSKVELTYDNWYCEKSLDEDDDGYALRSCETTETYIRRYPSIEGATSLFVLVTPR